MKKLFLIYSFCILITSCKQEVSNENNFQNYLNTIPEIKLPFKSNSYIDLQTKVEIDSTFKKFNSVDANGIYGKIKFNDSITGIVYLYAGDNVFPKLITYNKKGNQISEQILVNLPCGSDVNSSSCSSFVELNNTFKISRIDTVISFLADGTEISTVVFAKYIIESNGKISSLQE